MLHLGREAARVQTGNLGRGPQGIPEVVATWPDLGGSLRESHCPAERVLNLTVSLLSPARRKKGSCFASLTMSE